MMSEARPRVHDISYFMCRNLTVVFIFIFSSLLSRLSTVTVTVTVVLVAIILFFNPDLAK